MNMKHDNYILHTLLYTDQFKSDFISYYVTYLLCNNINQTRGLLCMSSSFPQFSVDEIILRHGSQGLYYFMIIHSSITLNTATPGAHSIILQIALLTGFIFYISLRCLQHFPKSFYGKFRNNCSLNRNFPEHYSVTFHNSRKMSRKFFPLKMELMVPTILN